ncbi:MAG: hypothetical protein U0941_04280 [Planctomycetaceae bacterium]
MSGQTIVQYGDVILYRCLTRQIEQRPVMDAGSTDLKCWRFIVQVTGYLHGWPSACQRQEIVGEFRTETNVPLVHQHVRWRLIPRQRFVIALGCAADLSSGETLFDIQPVLAVTPEDLTESGLSGVDVNDGPRCIQFDVVHVSADNIFKVDATFEVHVVQCDDDAEAVSNSSGVLSHRWSCSDSLDVNLRVTRFYRGTLELATSQFSPHWFRSLVIPPLQPGMRREKMDFTATEDGRTLQYTIIDLEVAVAAPYPARRWSVEHTEHSLNDSPLQSHSQIVVTLEGDSNVDKGELILLALYVISAKLAGVKPGESPIPNRPFVMRDLTIVDFTGDSNSIRASASCERLGQLVRDAAAVDVDTGLRICADGFRKIISQDDLPGFSLNYDPRRSASGRSVESPVYQGPVSLIGIFRCYLQSPCSPQHGVNQLTNILGADKNTIPSEAPIIAINAVIVPTITATDPPYYSASHREAMYTTYQMESIYQTDRLRAALPIAADPEGASESCAVVSLAPSQTKRIVRIAAERVGAWPEFPDPDTMEAGMATVGDPLRGILPIPQKMMSSKLLGGTRTRTCNGEEIYRARFEAVFVLLRTPSPTEILKFGQNKWSTDGGTESTTTLTNSPFP